ncbi:MAG: circularly permuted type 2 ATP-grasp protein [Thermoguttaceae bacterium]
MLPQGLNPPSMAVASFLPERLGAGYAPQPGGYDEMVLPDGSVRAPWQDFIRGLEDLGPQALRQHFDHIRRLLRENGVTYAIDDPRKDPGGQWELDPIPWLVAKSQWTSLAAGIAQRTHLLNLVVADLYGPQLLLRRGLIPPALVFGHPGFLRPCHGLPVRGGVYLHLYAGQLSHRPDGGWMVLSDHTREPTGTGLAVDNRIAMSRALPNDFQRLHVERLASFFMALQETLRSLAPHHTDNPRVVLLTPGPQSRTYVEDTYLARYLGYTLVEGADVTVRGTGVFLKTLGGLLPVDVILRRLPDDECDPLELRSSSGQGVTGIVQAARCGQVAIANALGAGILESPALMAFLPGIARQVLGEDLRLDSVPTWWCGHAPHWQYVREHFDAMVIRSAIFRHARPSIVTAQLSRRDREDLLETVRQRPAEYVAQAAEECSTAPIWRDGSLRPWSACWKTFAVAAANGQYQVMPGGLGRVSPDRWSLGESSSWGGVCKDVWVLSDGPVAKVTLLTSRRAAVGLRRSANDLPSRVAENLYWLGRNIERAETVVRQVRSCVSRMTGEMDPSYLPELRLLVGIACENSRFAGREDAGPEEAIEALRSAVTAFLFPPGREGHFGETLGAVVRVASVVRDRLSLDTWRIINQLHLDLLFPWPKDRVRLGDVLLVLNQMLNLLSALSGLGMESMTRGPGWRFMDMGRRIERAIQTLGLLRGTLARQSGELSALLEAILEVADSSMTYRYRYLTSLQLAPVLDLLLADETNPRSVAFQLAALVEHARELPGKQRDPFVNQEARIVLSAQGSLHRSDVESLAQTDPWGIGSNLNVFLDHLIVRLSKLSDSITRTYFTHTDPGRPLAELRPGSLLQ